MTQEQIDKLRACLREIEIRVALIGKSPADYGMQVIGEELAESGKILDAAERAAVDVDFAAWRAAGGKTK